MRFTLPFSVLVTQVMTVEAAGQTFGIPLDAVVETIRVPEEQHLSGRSRARDRVARPHDSARAAGAGRSRQGRARDGDEAGPIVIARIDGDLGALQVDRIGERMEIMLKPLDGLLSGLPGIAGSTLLGDGSVLLVSRPGGVAAMTVRVTTDGVIELSGRCGVEDAEVLQRHLLAAPRSTVEWSYLRAPALGRDSSIAGRETAHSRICLRMRFCRAHIAPLVQRAAS